MAASPKRAGNRVGHASMIRVKLTSILVNDQNRARAFYTEKLGFKIKHDVDIGGGPASTHAGRHVCIRG